MKKASPEFKAMVEANTWHNVSELPKFIEAIQAMTAPKVWTKQGGEVPGANYWSWARNMQCKYVDIRIDMRDGGFVLKTRDGERISLEQLQWQYGKDDDSA